MSTDVDLPEAFGEFREDLLREASFSGDPQHAVFFRMFAEAAAENGDIADLNYTPASREGNRPYQVDGYAWDADRGELHLAVCDYHPDLELEKINVDRVNQLLSRATRFCELAIDEEFVESLEETSPAFELAQLILQARRSISRIRCVIFSNARLATIKKTLESGEIIGAQATCNVFDFPRYVAFINSQGGTEPIELDVTELNGRPLPCLEAHDGNADCKSYLIVMPAKLLARAYGLYGSRLMEQNVRTFLQAKTKTNKGIIQTAVEAPDMFFAYNNGITATASDLELEVDENGFAGISRIKNLQIVNGGQTTATLLYASDRGEADLSRIFVQMKLSVIDAEKVGKIVPLISRYANTQNKVSEADFFSNHEFHQEMQKISRRLDAPRSAGELASTRWYYERTRGQYKNDGPGRSATERKRFEALYPKHQVVQKTDASKYYLTFEAMPHIVSKGAQKCFVAFADQIDAKWDSSRAAFNDTFFKDLICKTIVFRWLDKTVGRAAWYPDYRSLKAAIITYTIAWLVQHLKAESCQLDFDRIWALQEPQDELKACLESLAPQVAAKLKELGGAHGNVTEFAKNPNCWARISKSHFEVDSSISRATIDFYEAKARGRGAKAEGAIDLEIEFDRLVVENLHRMPELELAAKRRSILSPLSSRAFGKLRRGKISLSQPERNALKHLFGRLDQFNAGPSSWTKESKDA